MDPLSLITAIGGIAATGFKIAKAINDVVEELGTAGAQVKAVATDMRTVAVVLHELKIRLSRAKHVLTPEVAQVAHEIVELCKADIEDIEQSLSPLLAPEGEAMDLKRATKWLFTKSKIATKRASLDSLKLTLGLYMHTLQFIEGNYVEEYIRAEVDSMMSESKNTKTKFLNAERQEQMAEQLYAAALKDDEIWDASSQGDNALLDEVTDGDKEGERRRHATPVKALLPPSSPVNGEGGWAKNMQMQLYTPPDFSLIVAIPDDRFIKIAEHIRLQKMVSRFAGAVLREDTPSEEYEISNAVTEASRTSDTTYSSTMARAEPEDGSTGSLRQSPTRETSPTQPTVARNRSPYLSPYLNDILKTRSRKPDAASDSHGRESPPPAQQHSPWAAPSSPLFLKEGRIDLAGPYRSAYIGERSPPNMDLAVVPPRNYPYYSGAPFPSAPLTETYDVRWLSPKPDPELERLKMQWRRMEEGRIDHEAVPPRNHPYYSSGPFPSASLTEADDVRRPLLKFDPELERLTRQLRLMESERLATEDNKKRRVMEDKILQGAEDSLLKRMEEMKKRQEEVKQGVELIKAAAQQSAQDNISREGESQGSVWINGVAQPEF